jgi:hypothetical protein
VRHAKTGLNFKILQFTYVGAKSAVAVDVEFRSRCETSCILCITGNIRLFCLPFRERKCWMNDAYFTPPFSVLTGMLHCHLVAFLHKEFVAILKFDLFTLLL